MVSAMFTTPITPAMLQRKGASRIADIAPEVLAALNAGAIATVNLNEFLAIDLAALASGNG